MGTIINLTVIAKSAGEGEKAIAATYAEIERLVAIFSHRESKSPVTVLNNSGKLAKPPREIVEVLSEAVQISEITGGAFDVTVKPLVDLYQQTQPNLPTEEAVQDTLKLVDYSQLRYSPEEISFTRSGMAVTLDGIAKGYIVDAGSAVLKKLGFANVYVEAGGDLMASGLKDIDQPWKIGIQSPRESKPGLLAQIIASDQAVATSGDYFQHFSKDMLHHHIIDPRMGFSSPELASVTVVSGRVLQSDALATAVMVLGVDRGLALLESLDMVEGYLVTKSLGEYQTAGFA
jgi:thiamine biosynthesis lipoprotein